MKSHSISEAASIPAVDRKTLRRWIQPNHAPAATPGIVDGILSKFCTEKEMKPLRKYRATSDWSKGIDRRTGKKAKQKKP
jgi:hypothetical protein